MTPQPLSNGPPCVWPAVEGHSSFHDVTLLATPLLSETDRLPGEGGESDHHGSSQGIQKATTVRILKFGFGKKTDSTASWRWDPFEECRGRSAEAVSWKLLTSSFPCLEWMATYKWRYLKGDFVAGLSVGFMLIPQGMAYARVAGLPPVYGLYTGWVPSLIYAIFGSSRQMALGPTSLVSLLVGEAVSKIVDSESTEEADMRRYLSLALLLALMVGAIQMLAGLVRLGWTVRFLSHAVVSGFSSGAAIIIGLTQMRYFLGYRYPRSDKVHILVRDILLNLKYIDYPSLTLGSSALIFLLVMKHYGKTYKKVRVLRTLGPILTVTLGTLFIYFSGNPWGIRVAGAIPSGPPELFLSFPWLDWETLLMPSLVIAGGAYLESVGLAKALAAKNGYSIDANQELVGLGMANVVGSMFSAYPTGGSFSRSIVNNECGAKTGLAGFVAAMLIFCALVFLTPLFELLPLPVLAAIVMSSVVGLVDYEEAIFFFRVDKKDFTVWLLAFLGTLFFGIQVGVLVSLFISLGFVIDESANPQCAVLGRLPGTTVYRNVEQYPDARTTPGIIALRFHSPLYFANVSNVKEALRKYESCSNTLISQADLTQSQPVQYVIVDLTSVSSVDSAACQAILDIHQEYKARGIRLALTNPNHVVMNTLERADIPDLIGRQWFFVRVYDAVRVCKADMARALGAAPPAASLGGTPLPAFPAEGASFQPQGSTAPPSVFMPFRDSRSPDQLAPGGGIAPRGLAGGRTSRSPLVDIHGGGKTGEAAIDLGAHSAPEVLQSQHVLLDEFDSDLFPESPTFHVCDRCKGLRGPTGSPTLQLQARHVLLNECVCRRDCGRRSEGLDLDF